MGRIAKPLPTSFSALDSFETCPLKHYLTRVSKEVPDPPGEAIQWGNTVHKALEKYLRDEAALPKSVAPYQKYADQIKRQAGATGANLLVENQLCVDEAFQPTGWWDKNGWFRGVIDVALMEPTAARVFDWKTGKQKDNFDQLEMFAALITSHYPEVETIHSAFVWLQPRKLTKKTFAQEAARRFWAKLTPRVDRLQEAFETNKWPARPSGLCKNWCPVGSKNCSHCGV